MKRLISSVFVVLVAFACSAARAGQIGFEEDFALAKDRGAVLKQLIPGTEDYYFYSCLNLQNTGKLDEVDALLKLWIERYNRTPRVVELENRQALLRYEQDPAKSLAYLQQKLGLTFAHERIVPGQKPTLATSLDAALISRDAFAKRSLSINPGTVNGFEDAGIEWFVRGTMTDDQRRSVLSRLQRPDYPGIAKLVVDDLNYRYSGGFGSFPVHGMLLLAQLDEALRLKPDLLNQGNFVNAYLSKLAPGADVDAGHDVNERAAYYDRLWEFVARLDPVHNSLKACVLYNRLVHDRALGVYDKARFMEYIKLPRTVFYISRPYLDNARQRGVAVVDLNANYQGVARLIVIRQDEPLVRDYLSHFFVAEDSTKPYEPYIDDTYLKHLFAETKIVNGIGDPEQWYSMLRDDPAFYQALKERVDLDFAETNKAFFGADEAVGLDLYVKNVDKLIVKVFEINALNFYREKGEEIGTDANLDGLVANDEQVLTYTDAPLRRVKRHFDFPSLTKRGVYIVEFIGNGRSSRALVRKGQLRFIERTSAAGHVFTVLDDANRRVPTATLWLAGREYAPEKDGTIALPFSNKPGREKIVLRSGDFASLASFDHESEAYRLVAGIYVDRESLLRRKKATVVVRPALYVNDAPVAIGLLETPSLTVTSVDGEQVSTAKEVPDFKLFDDRESTFEFQVPENVRTLTFTLKGKIQNLSQAQKQDVAVSQTWTLNSIDATEKTEDLHLRHVAGAYALDVLGKTGEALADRPVNFRFKHRDFKDAMDVSLQTAASGVIALGGLDGIDWLSATSPQGVTHTWYVLDDVHSYPACVHAAEGDVVSLPYMGAAKATTGEEISLLEKRGGTFVRDAFEFVKIEDGFLTLAGLPRGDYDLWIKPAQAHIAVRIANGAKDGAWLLGENRHLEVRNAAPLQIAAIDADKDNVKVRLANASKFARVHVIATRYMPEYSLPAELGKVGFPSPALAVVGKLDAVYVEGRDIGDEYRYILERKYAVKFPGNMLTRPGLLLNPWAINKTETTLQGAGEGANWLGRGAPGEGYGLAGKRAGGLTQRGRAETITANLDFLGEPSVVLANLRPDAQGVVTIARKDLGAHTQLHVLACDPQNTVYREVSLDDVATTFNDLRLGGKEGAASLDPAKHFAERKEITVVKPGDKFTVADVSTAKFELYDTLAKTYGLYATLSNSDTLGEFSFILRWPKMTDAEKQEKYSKYACHELNYFIFRKDPAFFTKAVQPYLKNKKDKTFLDDYLISADLSESMKPWRHEQLNIMERVLLAERIANERPATARHVSDLYDLLPPDVERFNMLFTTALKGAALETGRPGWAGEVDKITEGAAKKEALATRFEAPGAPAPAAVPMERKAGEARALAATNGRYADAELEKQLGDRNADFKKRDAVRQFYRKLEKTEELAENNYYHVLIGDQNAGLVTVNAFWRDFAVRDAGPFLSRNLAEASRNFPEMMLALAATDLPFEAKEPAFATSGTSLTLTPAGPMIVYHKEIKEAEVAADSSVLVGQNFFRLSDRYAFVNNERRDKYVTDEFLVGVVYGCQVVVTNPTSAPQKLDALLQIPRGAMPVKNGFVTRGVHVELAPYNTTTIEYHFYFPAAGKFTHYPVHVARDEKIVNAVAAVTLNVVDEPTKVDTTSWDYVSQNATPEQVVEYLKNQNVNRVDLAQIAWRVKDPAFFRQALGILAARHVYNDTLWSYGIRHNELSALREYLQHADGFVSQCGAWLDSKPLAIDPVLRKDYQHLEYSPLVNARAHRLGKQNVIVNDRFYQQYERLMRVLAYRPTLDDDDLMAVTYALLLQDRVEEGLAFLARVNPAKLATPLQYDYFRAYADFYTDDHRLARGIAAKYAAYPVDRWRNLFANVLAQLDEAEGLGPKVVDKEDRTQKLGATAAAQSNFDFTVESKQILLDVQNLTEARISYYPMDIELLFSRSPFVQEYSGQFAFIKPNETSVVPLVPGVKRQVIPLPAKYHSSNVMVEIEAGGLKKSRAYFSNALAVQVVENYGQIKVAHQTTGRALPKVYVKVYARMAGGGVEFYKDGYTDLRGCFDYASLSTNQIDNVERFSILLMSETDGAVVKEAAPPKR